MLQDEGGEQGVLNLGLFDLESDEHIRLYPSGDSAFRSRSRTPIIVLANYIFDLPFQTFPPEAVRSMSVCTTAAASSIGEELVNPEMSNFHLDWGDAAHLAGRLPLETPQSSKSLAGYLAGLEATQRWCSRVGRCRTIQQAVAHLWESALYPVIGQGYTHEDELFCIHGQYVQFHGAVPHDVQPHQVRTSMCAARW